MKIRSVAVEFSIIVPFNKADSVVMELTEAV